MQSWTERSRAVLVAVYVAVPALVVGALSCVLVYVLAPVNVRVSGTVSLSVLAGNEYDHRLNAYASDLDAALASPPVDSAVQEALGGSGEVRGLRAERGDEASQVELELAATSERAGAAAVLAAGRTALFVLTLDRQQELLVREQSARQALQARLSAGEVLAGPAAGLDDPLQQARGRAVERALADLAEVQSDLAVVRELLAAEPFPGVSVDDVTPVSQLDRAVRTSLSGGLAAAFVGALLLHSRRVGRSVPTGPPRTDEGQLTPREAPATSGRAPAST